MTENIPRAVIGTHSLGENRLDPLFETDVFEYFAGQVTKGSKASALETMGCMKS